MAYFPDDEQRQAKVKDFQDIMDRLWDRYLGLEQEGLENMPETDTKQDNMINLLHVQQQRMSEDIRGINVTLNRVADALSSLAVLEQKHNDSMDTIKRAHSRQDKFENKFEDTCAKFNDRITAIELHNAKNIWIERIFSTIVVAVVLLWTNGKL